MILFVFEGQKIEPKLFDAMQNILGIKDKVVCTWNSDIYSLYIKIKDDKDVNVFRVLQKQLEKRCEDTLKNYQSQDFSETYFFFDYDFQDRKHTISERNCAIQEMFTIFNNETENGKLYISYPMVEAIRYCKKLPDPDYNNYVVSQEECLSFKALTSQFSGYGDYKFLDTIGNWRHLVEMNVRKANYLCQKHDAFPSDISDICQDKIFEVQCTDFVNQDPPSVAILSAFPLFVIDYCGVGILEEVV